MADFDLETMMLERPLRYGPDSATGSDYFDYAPKQPNLYLLMRFKQLLVKAYGLAGGFEVYRQRIAKPEGARLRLRPLESHYERSRSDALEFHEIIAPGEPFTIEAPTVIGEGDHRPLRNVTRSFYVSCLADACVRGRSSIVEASEAALADFQDEELDRIDDEVEFDSAVFHRDGGRIWMISSDRPDIELDTAFSLLGCRTDFFGDWLWDSIMRYVGATRGGFLPPAPILIDENMPKTHRQALEMMLAPGASIIEIPAFRAVHVRRLWWAPAIAYMPFHQKLNERFKWDYLTSSPRLFAEVEDEMGRRADLRLGTAGARGPERVFLARKDFRHRKLVNRPEVEDVARSHGFAIVYPEEFDFADQVKLARDARYIVAPEGSSLFLCTFLRPGAKVCVLNHRLTEGLTIYNSGAEAKGRELTVITGPEAGERRGRSQDMNYVIDAQVFRRFLEQWFGVAGPAAGPL